MNDTVLFSDLSLDPKLLKSLDEAGYQHPTPVQQQAIPAVLQGRDLMAGAQTGTGKTAAFTLPLLQRLLPLASGSTSPAKHPVRALILTPTRELAMQVAQSVETYARHTRLRTAVVYGGVDIKQQEKQLRKGVEVVVATPGRLLDHLEMQTFGLQQVQMLVLDEADRMLDMGFMPDLTRIVKQLPAQRQTLLFSATFSKEIKKLAADFLTAPQTIEVARQNATSDNIEQQVYMVHHADKRAQLVTLLQQHHGKQAIIFTRTKLTASKLVRQLLQDKISAGAIHGNKTQRERMQALEAFRQGELDVLVGTDVAARGLDIDALPLVFNYELPNNAEDYVHRIGRTGRAGASGLAISLVSSEEEKLLTAIEKLIKRTLERQPGTVRDTRSDKNTKKRKTRKQHDAPAHKDDWFNQPYQPGVFPQKKLDGRKHLQQLNQEQRRQLPALLKHRKGN